MWTRLAVIPRPHRLHTWFVIVLATLNQALLCGGSSSSPAPQPADATVLPIQLDADGEPILPAARGPLPVTILVVDDEEDLYPLMDGDRILFEGFGQTDLVARIAVRVRPEEMLDAAPATNPQEFRGRVVVQLRPVAEGDPPSAWRDFTARFVCEAEECTSVAYVEIFHLNPRNDLRVAVEVVVESADDPSFSGAAYGWGELFEF
jgi:hypothetical protein